MVVVAKGVQLVYGAPLRVAHDICTHVKIIVIVALLYVPQLVTIAHDCVVPVKDIMLGTQKAKNLIYPLVINKKVLENQVRKSSF